MTLRKKLPQLSDAQLEIMNIVWDRQECSVADIWKILTERRGVTRNTVHTLVTRLEDKKWLKRRTRDGSVTYVGTVTRESTQQQCVRRLIDTVFDGSAEGLVLALLNDGTVTQDESNRIRDRIAKARKGKKS